MSCFYYCRSKNNVVPWLKRLKCSQLPLYHCASNCSIIDYRLNGVDEKKQQTSKLSTHLMTVGLLNVRRISVWNCGSRSNAMFICTVLVAESLNLLIFWVPCISIQLSHLQHTAQRYHSTTLKYYYNLEFILCYPTFWH